MKFLKCLLLFGSCMSTSSGKLHGGADIGITKKIDQLIKQNRDNNNLLMNAIKAEKGATYLWFWSKKKRSIRGSEKYSCRLQEAVAQGYKVTYSSTWRWDHANPRIRGNSKLVKAWCAKVNNQKQWIQVNLKEPKTILAIEMAKRGDYPQNPQWVKTYKVSYTMNGIDWKYYKNGQLLQGYNEETKLTPFTAKIVRVHPWTWNAHISLRFEVYFSDKMKPTTYTKYKGICQNIENRTMLRQWRDKSTSSCKALCYADCRCKFIIAGDERYYQKYTDTCELYTGGSAFSADGNYQWSCYVKN